MAEIGDGAFEAIALEVSSRRCFSSSSADCTPMASAWRASSAAEMTRPSMVRMDRSSWMASPFADLDRSGIQETTS